MSKIDLIKKDLLSGNEDYLGSDVVFWVDWREEDDSIVKYCESILNTGKLSANMHNVGEDLCLTIVYDGKTFTEKIIDRDPTLILLNSIIQPDYEIRFCNESDGNDTLAFLPLTKEEWKNLENEVGKDIVDSKFAEIKEGSQMFSKEWDFNFEDFDIENE